jgi:hypothetical protein
MSAFALQYPSLPRLGRRGRLARFLVVLSLTVVLGAGFAMRAGAGVSLHHAPQSYVSMIVAPGETLWSIASVAAGTVNSLSTPDVSPGQSLRVPA